MPSWKSLISLRSRDRGQRFDETQREGAAGLTTTSIRNPISLRQGAGSSGDKNIFPSGLVQLYTGVDCVVDIIFIHGLTGNRETTWKAGDATTPWPQSLLPSKIPNARILTFGYDASVAGRGAVSINRIGNHALNLLNAIATFRNDNESDTNMRPIIFVCHSLGGLVCEDALSRASDQIEEHLQQVQQSTRGICFLGTPQHGSALAKWAEGVAKALGLVKQTNTDILAVLKSDSEVLERLQDSFYATVMSRRQDKNSALQITCFYEELPMTGIGCIVPRHSAVLPNFNAIGIRSNHSDMTKFACQEDPGFKAIVGELHRWIKNLTPSEALTQSPHLVTKAQRVTTKAPKSIFKVNPGSNSFFTGREQELQRLHSTLMTAIEAERRGMCTIHGPPGIGKTQLSLEYAHRYRHEFEAIFWLPAQHGAPLAQRFGEIASTVSRLEEVGASSVTSDLAAMVRKAKTWLENTKDWRTIKPYWPPGTSGAIIIVTQNSDLVQITGGAEVLPVTFSPEEGAALLFRHLRKQIDDANKLDFQNAKEVSVALGGLPVALSHCAGYIEKSQCTLVEFKVLYMDRSRSRQVWSEDCSIWTHQYQHTLETTWDIALSELLPHTKALLNVLAMLDADAISEDMICEGHDLMTPDQIRSLILSLGKRILVRREIIAQKAYWFVHRALQRSLLHRLDDDHEARQTAFDTALRIIRRSLPRQSNVQAPSNDKWQASEACLVHVIQLQRVYSDGPSGIIAPREFAEVLADVGNYMWERGLYHPGIDSLKLAKRVYEGLREQDLVEQSKVVSLLAAINLEIGISGRRDGLDYTAQSRGLRDRHAQVCADQAIEISQDEIVLQGNSLNDTACCMMEYGCFDMVETLLERSLDVKRNAGIQEHQAVFNYAENYKNLSLAKTAVGDYNQAVHLAARAAAMMEADMGRMTATAQSFRFHLAYNLYRANRLSDALREHDQVRRARIEIFGEDGVHTLNSYYACSVVYLALGNLAKAEEYLLHCIPKDDDHSWTSEYLARVKLRLAMVWNAAGRHHKDVQRLKTEAQMVYDQYASFFLPFETLPGLEPREMVIYDNMIPIEGGRSTIGQLNTPLRSLGRVTELLG